MDKIKVLIVDDSPVVRQAISAILSSDKEIEITGTASNPFEAADLIKNQIPDVITLDIEMPKMDGHHLLKRIREENRLEGLPVFVFSSLINEEMRRKGEALGADGQISKPEIVQLIDLIDKKIL